MKKYTFTALLAILFLLLCSCSSTKEGTKNKLTLGILSNVDSVPVVMAENKDYFKDNNINVEIQLFNNSFDMGEALKSGKIDGAVSDMISVLFEKQEGLDLKITSKTNGNYKLVAGKNSNINDLSELTGRGIALSQNTAVEYAADIILSYGNVDVSHINKIVIPQVSTQLEMLKNGQIASTILQEPIASAAINDGASLLSSTDALGINPGVILFASDAINTKDKELKKFYKAYNKAVELLTKENPANFTDVLVQKAGFPESFKNSPSFPSYERASIPSYKEFENVMNWLKNSKQIQVEFKYSDIVYTDFIK